MLTTRFGFEQRKCVAHKLVAEYRTVVYDWHSVCPYLSFIAHTLCLYFMFRDPTEILQQTHLCVTTLFARECRSDVQICGLDANLIDFLNFTQMRSPDIIQDTAHTSSVSLFAILSWVHIGSVPHNPQAPVKTSHCIWCCFPHTCYAGRNSSLVRMRIIVISCFSWHVRTVCLLLCTVAEARCCCCQGWVH